MLEREPERTACTEYEARLEEYLEGMANPAAAEDLRDHLERCPACREALAVARLARELLCGGCEPAPRSDPAFAARVLASIRSEELGRQQFWRPLEVLASRLAVTAAAALLVLGVYLFEFAPAQNRGQGSSQAEISEGLLEPVRQPASQDEVLLTLAGSSYGR